MTEKSDRIVIRKLNPKDNFDRVAQLIYYTDDYVFPYLYDNDIEKATAVIGKMIASDTIYNYKNVTVAVLDGQIIGIVVALQKPFSVNMGEMVSCFLTAGAVIDERFSKVFNEYYNLIDGKSDGVYIANVCVNRNYRNMGVAGRLLDYVLRNDCEYELETVKANEAAYKLYTAHGFEVEYEYPGFTGIPCYKMNRKKTTEGE